MKMQKYVMEFTGTVIGKDKVPFIQTFYVVAESLDAGLLRLQGDNPKVTDFVSTGHFTACNQDW
jgi:hypothetical protein